MIIKFYFFRTKQTKHHVVSDKKISDILCNNLITVHNATKEDSLIENLEESSMGVGKMIVSVMVFLLVTVLVSSNVISTKMKK